LRILVVASTNREVKLLTDRLQLVNVYRPDFLSFRYGNLLIDILITGVGSIFMTYHLTKILGTVSYDMAVNIGMASSFDYFLEQGFVVNVIQDQFADLGFEEKEAFFTLGEKELMDENTFPFTEEVLRSIGNFELNEIEALIPVKAITVNTIHGAPENIARKKQKFSPEIETMDGAAFFFVCLNEKVPFLQIRAIASFVEIRKIENWNIPLALKNLTDTVMAVFNELKIE
jgi:futalosine hydrolase